MDDNDYVDKVLAGDKDAFRYFIKKYQQKSLAIAYRITGAREDAEEAVQEGFVRAYRNLASFRKEAKFSTWLFRIVHREALRLCNKRKRYSGNMKDIEDENPVSNQQSPLESIEQKEMSNTIKKVLTLLKPNERLVLQLFYLEEMSMPEINEITGFSVSKIKTLLFRARKSFSQVFNEKTIKSLLV